MSKFDVIVIGSGPNELTLACLLAQDSRAKVLVLEPSAHVGGVMAPVEITKGFSIEPGDPTSGFMSPKLARELSIDFAPEVNTSLIGYGEPGAAPLVLDAERSDGIASKSDTGAWPTFHAKMIKLAAFLEKLYAREAPELMADSAAEFWSLAGLGLALRRMGKADMIELIRTLPMSLADLLDDTFESDLLKATIAATGLSNLFQGPRSQGTSFSLLHHMAGRPSMGARFSDRKTSLLASLERRAKALGVEVRASSPCTILLEGDAAKGVRVGKETLSARAVVSGYDPRKTFLELASPRALDPDFVRAVKNVKFRGVRSVLGLALGELPNLKKLDGSLTFAPHLDWLERSFDAAKRGEVAKQLAITAHVPTLTDPSLAPKGKHVMHVSVQFTPYSNTVDVADAAIAQLAEHAPNLKSAIVAHRLWSPKQLEADYGITEGHLYGGELTLDQILFMRPIPGYARYKTPITSLFMCGDSTHPGGGLPGASGALAARVISTLI